MSVPKLIVQLRELTMRGAIVALKYLPSSYHSIQWNKKGNPHFSLPSMQMFIFPYFMTTINLRSVSFDLNALLTKEKSPRFYSFNFSGKIVISYCN